MSSAMPDPIAKWHVVIQIELGTARSARLFATLNTMFNAYQRLKRDPRSTLRLSSPRADTAAAALACCSARGGGHL